MGQAGPVQANALQAGVVQSGDVQHRLHVALLHGPGLPSIYSLTLQHGKFKQQVSCVNVFFLPTVLDKIKITGTPAIIIHITNNIKIIIIAFFTPGSMSYNVGYYNIIVY